MPDFRLDRTAFKAHSVAEAADYSEYYKQKSWQERLQIAAYLNAVAFNYPLDNPPKMDKTKCKARSNKS